MSEWRAWFAWRPVRTIAGRLVWRRRVERRWNWQLNDWIEAGGHSGTDGGWEYRLPLCA